MNNSSVYNINEKNLGLMGLSIQFIIFLKVISNTRYILKYFLKVFLHAVEQI